MIIQDLFRTNIILLFIHVGKMTLFYQSMTDISIITMKNNLQNHYNSTASCNLCSIREITESTALCSRQEVVGNNGDDFN